MGINSTNINKMNSHLSSYNVTELTEHKKSHDIWCWKSRSWFGIGIKIFGVKSINEIPPPLLITESLMNGNTYITAGNWHKQNSWFCKEIREDNFRFWWRRVHEDASQGMYMSKIEIFFFTARILQNQRMLCCGECFHD